MSDFPLKWTQKADAMTLSYEIGVNNVLIWNVVISATVIRRNIIGYVN